jgi:phosphoserine phosphatase
VHATQVVVFDFDGVITSRDTMAYVCRLRLLSDPRRLVAAVPSLVRRVLARDAGARQRADAAIVGSALIGLDHTTYDELVRQVVSRFIASDWLRSAFVTELRTEAASGRAVIATASETGLVRALVEALGISDVRVLGSQLERAPKGLRFGLHNVGEQKHATLRAAGIPLARARFFTDSLHDLPVAEACAETVFVGADRGAFDRLPRATWWREPVR